MYPYHNHTFLFKAIVLCQPQTCFSYGLITSFLQFKKKAFGVRNCFHPGASNLGPNQLANGKAKTDVGGWKIIRAMIGYVWPKDKIGLRIRVVVALSLLVGAKVNRCTSNSIYICFNLSGSEKLGMCAMFSIN